MECQENNSSEKTTKKSAFLDAGENFYVPIKGTFHSQVKFRKSDTLIAGVDEAGRGPVLGPMVYSVAYCLFSYEKKLKKYGFSDSKTLMPEKREQLLQALYSNDELKNNVGWSTCMISAREISEGMLNIDGSYNLNAQAHDTTIQLLHEVFQNGLNILEIYVDTVGPTSSYQVKLQRLFPRAKITVAEKADSTYPIVSVASICAKVTRDRALAMSAIHGEAWGSGYPSDPKTCEWLKSSMNPIFGWPYEIVRYSWQTAKDLLENNTQKKNNSKVHVKWYSNSEKHGTPGIYRYFQTPKTMQENIDLSWYGQNVELDDF